MELTEANLEKHSRSRGSGWGDLPGSGMLIYAKYAHGKWATRPYPARSLFWGKEDPEVGIVACTPAFLFESFSDSENLNDWVKLVEPGKQQEEEPWPIETQTVTPNYLFMNPDVQPLEKQVDRLQKLVDKLCRSSEDVLTKRELVAAMMLQSLLANPKERPAVSTALNWADSLLQEASTRKR